MDLKIAVTFVSVIFLIFLLTFYLFPFNTVTFNSNSGNYNFSIISNNTEMQFYPNMRFANTDLSYRISDCSLQKQNDMQNAFRIIENLTPLVFYPVNSGEDISVTCQNRAVIQNGFFIAGEGGPTNVTIAGSFDVITHGEILLIRNSDCPRPNVAIHELFHVLGFKHSTNPENVMYNITSCDQTIGQDMIQTINNLYSIPSEPDLIFENASAMMSGRFLNANFTVSNAGLADAGSSAVDIYADGSLAKEIDIDALPIGTGRIVSVENIFVPQISVKEIEMDINYTSSEISKDNNKIKLE